HLLGFMLFFDLTLVHLGQYFTKVSGMIGHLSCHCSLRPQLRRPSSNQGRLALAPRTHGGTAPCSSILSAEPLRPVSDSKSPAPAASYLLDGMPSRLSDLRSPCATSQTPWSVEIDFCCSRTDAEGWGNLPNICFIFFFLRWFPNKTSLRMAVARIKLLRNRKEVQVHQMRHEVAQLLEANQDMTARIRVEHVIREEKFMQAYDLIEVYYELIVA
ncbi:hypothetical protein ACJX0J_027462, partial [Zea mays]